MPAAWLLPMPARCSTGHYFFTTHYYYFICQFYFTFPHSNATKYMMDQLAILFGLDVNNFFSFPDVTMLRNWKRICFKNCEAWLKRLVRVNNCKYCLTNVSNFPNRASNISNVTLQLPMLNFEQYLSAN